MKDGSDGANATVNQVFGRRGRWERGAPDTRGTKPRRIMVAPLFEERSAASDSEEIFRRSLESK